MVHFDFIVDDIDAETIFDAVGEVQKEAFERLHGIRYDPVLEDLPTEGHKEWWQKREQYGKELLAMMKHKQV